MAKKYVLPKIMIGIPTYDQKNYCLEYFMDNLNGFTYPKNLLEIYVADNSKTNKNALHIRDKYGVKTFWKNYDDYTLFEILATDPNIGGTLGTVRYSLSNVIAEFISE